MCDQQMSIHPYASLSIYQPFSNTHTHTHTHTHKADLQSVQLSSESVSLSSKPVKKSSIVSRRWGRSSLGKAIDSSCSFLCFARHSSVGI